MSQFVRIRPRGTVERRGAAAVELAICLPLLVLLGDGLDRGLHDDFPGPQPDDRQLRRRPRGHQLRRHECRRFGPRNAIINSRDINGAKVTLNPTDVASAERGEPIAVTVSAPCNLNMIIPPWFYDGRTLRATMTMVKE